MAGHTLGQMEVVIIMGGVDRPGQVEEDTRAEEFPLLWLLDSQGEDSLKAKQKDGDGKVPVVRVILHGHNPGYKETLIEERLLYS